MTRIRSKDRDEGGDYRGLLLKTAAGFAAMAAVLVSVVFFATERIVRDAIAEDAERQATTYLKGAVGILQDIDPLISEDRVNSWQVGLLKGMMQFTDVFRLKVFDADATRALAINRTSLGYEIIDTTLDEGAIVLRTGRPLSKVSDGRTSSIRPDTYIESYVPVSLPNGDVRVVEVYIDVTHLAASLAARLDFYGGAFVIGGLLLYCVPAGFLAWRTRDLRRRDRAIMRMSRRDPLTGLLNRSEASQRFRRLLPKHELDRTTLFYLDIDRFKAINDTLGHAGGDLILKRIAECLREISDPDDIASRFGGDEFVLVRRHPPGETDETLAEALLEIVSQPLDVLGQHVRPAISIGGYGLRPGNSFDEALRLADFALYEAKTNGRGQYVRHTEKLVRRSDRRNAVEKRLRAAIATDAFYLEYQPIYCGRAERLMGFEALLRLQGDDAKAIPPAEFIPVAEQAGLIGDIGSIALRRALEVARNWPDDIYIAVNVSALQFGSGSFPQQVADEIARTGIAPERIELELTESVFLGDDSTTQIEIADLKALGVKLALDDFGTGYSSLAYLWRLPFDKVKIDRAFLEGYEYDREKYQQFISTVVLLGRQMGMKITAEGLETTDQLAMLEEIGVQGYQGYLLGRPLPEAVATDYAHRRPPPALMVLDDIENRRARASRPAGAAASG